MRLGFFSLACLSPSYATNIFSSNRDRGTYGRPATKDFLNAYQGSEQPAKDVLLYSLHAKSDLLEALNEVNSAENYLYANLLNFNPAANSNPFYDDYMFNANTLSRSFGPTNNPNLNCWNQNMNLFAYDPYGHCPAPRGVYPSGPYFNTSPYGNVSPSGQASSSIFARSGPVQAPERCPGKDQVYNAITDKCQKTTAALKTVEGPAAGFRNIEGEEEDNSISSPSVESNGVPPGKCTLDPTKSVSYSEVKALLADNFAQFANRNTLLSALAKFEENNPDAEPRQLGFCQEHRNNNSENGYSLYSEGSICRFKCQENYKVIGESGGGKIMKCVCNGSDCDWMYHSESFISCGNMISNPEEFVKELARIERQEEREAKILQHIDDRREALRNSLGFEQVYINQESVESDGDLDYNFRRWDGNQMEDYLQSLGLGNNQEDEGGQAGESEESVEEETEVLIPGENPYYSDFVEGQETSNPIKIGTIYLQPVPNPIQWVHIYAKIIMGNVEANIDPSDIFLLQGFKFADEPDKLMEQRMFFYQEILNYINTNLGENLYDITWSQEMYDTQRYSDYTDSQVIFYRKDKLELENVLQMPLNIIKKYPAQQFSVLQKEFDVPPTMFVFKRRDGTDGIVRNFNIIAVRGTKQTDVSEYNRVRAIEPTNLAKLNEIKSMSFKNETARFPGLYDRFVQMGLGENTPVDVSLNTIWLGAVFGDCHWNRKKYMQEFKTQWVEEGYRIPDYTYLESKIDGGQFDWFKSRQSTYRPCISNKRCWPCMMQNILVKSMHEDENYKNKICNNWHAQPTYKLPEKMKWQRGYRFVQTACTVE